MRNLNFIAAVFLALTLLSTSPEAAQTSVLENQANDRKALANQILSSADHDQARMNEEDHKEDGHKEDGHKEEGHKEEGHKGGDNHKTETNKGSAGEHGKEDAEVRLKPEQLSEAGITVAPLRTQLVPTTLSVPGEVKLNQYETRIITPRIPAMVLGRHAKVGDHIRRGQNLATLFSVEMAQAQGEYIVASAEWQRVRQLGEKIVSAKRATEAEVSFQQARARLQAYGLSAAQIAKTSKNGNRSNPGQFEVTADRDGLIVFDDFLVGEMIEPGKSLYRITDPVSRWIEARVNPREVESISPESEVTIQTGNQTYRGKIVQLAQEIDEQTRTLGVRIEFIDSKSSLRPGQFVDVLLNGRSAQLALAVPKDAIVRTDDGDWAVFHMVSPGQFKSREVRVVRETDDLAVIEGIPAGAQIVTKGAFFVQSELAKSGFDIHNH